MEPIKIASSDPGGSMLKYADRLLGLKVTFIDCPARARNR
jgi:hypothetical protein